MGAPFLKSMAHGGASFEIYGPEPAMGAPVLKSTARNGHGGAGAPPTLQNTRVGLRLWPPENHQIPLVSMLM